MRKGLIILWTIVLLIVLLGCSSKEIEKSENLDIGKSAYEDINVAADICVDALNILNATCNVVNYEKCSGYYRVEEFCQETGLEFEDVRTALVTLGYTEYKMVFLEGEKAIAVSKVAMKVSGRFEKLEKFLDSAQTKIKQISDEYSQDAMRLDLEEYYLKVDESFQYIRSLSLTWDGLGNKMTEYKELFQTYREKFIEVYGE